MQLIDELISKILTKNKLQQNFLEESIKTLSIDDARLLEGYMQYCFENAISIEYLAECYNLLVNDTVKEQMYFKKYKKYRYSTYIDVASIVYDNPQYMQKYMHGLAIAIFLWPTQREILKFFRN